MGSKLGRFLKKQARRDWKREGRREKGKGREGKREKGKKK